MGLPPSAVTPSDLAALIGLLATLEGHSMGGGIDQHLVAALLSRLESDGLVSQGASERDLRQALNDLNHRLRFALGEYDEPPTSLPVP